MTKSLGRGQSIEMIADSVELLCGAPDYPIQPKKHTMEFLREVSHLRLRTTTFQAVFRIRNSVCFAIHKFFQERGYMYVNTPIITATDAEGAGDMFSVISTDLSKAYDPQEDFFGKHVNLTVSGQLEAETAIFGLGAVYTFGPTFRAENSNTTRHLAEFWMVEPETAFFDLNDNIQLATDFLKYVINAVLEQCPNELLFLENRSKENHQIPLIEKLKGIVDNDFTKITYTEAIDILIHSEANKSFTYRISEWGCDLQSEHERYLVEQHFKTPVIVTDYPKSIKAFYMRQNDDNKTTAAMDILFPGIGEIIGGSQREERYEKLLEIINERHMDSSTLQWYLDTRRFGSVIHSGFGLGLERLIQFVTDVDNIRDVILYPRTPKHITP
jgi:asparaginyl-tRNA synthetase